MATLKKKKRSFFGRIWRFCLKLAILFFVLSIGSTIVYRWVNPPVTPLMIIRLFGQKMDGKELKMKYDWVDIDSISPNMWHAAIVQEDPKFLYHNGFDWDAIKIAQEYNKTHKNKRGASTISQQTAKNVFLWPDRTWIRKGLEVYFTFLIETFWSKERIMEVYLNIIEFGDGIYGVNAAADEYFKNSAAKLSREQAISLAACIPGPLIMNVKKPTQLYYIKKSFINRYWGYGPEKELVKHPYSEWEQTYGKKR